MILNGNNINSVNIQLNGAILLRFHESHIHSVKLKQDTHSVDVEADGLKPIVKYYVAKGKYFYFFSVENL